MYLRLLGITFAFNLEIAKNLLIPFLGLALLSIGISIVLYLKSKKDPQVDSKDDKDQNPLELSTAFLFAFLFDYFIGEIGVKTIGISHHLYVSEIFAIVLLILMVYHLIKQWKSKV